MHCCWCDAADCRPGVPMGYCPRCTAEHEMLEAQLLADNGE